MGKLHDDYYGKAHASERHNQPVEPWSGPCPLCRETIDQHSAQLHFARSHGVMACGGGGVWSRETALEVAEFIEKIKARAKEEG